MPEEKMITENSTIRDGAVRPMTFHHPLHLMDRVAMAAVRLMVGSMKVGLGPSTREQFDELMEKTPPADGVNYEKAEVGGVVGWWCRPDDAIAGQVAARAKVSAFVPEYGLAPEHAFP